MVPPKETGSRVADRDAEEASDEHVRPEVNPEIHARQGDRACKDQERDPEPGVKDADRGRGSKRGCSMARRERGRVRKRDESLDRRIGEWRPGALCHELHQHRDAFGDRGGSGGRERGSRQRTSFGCVAAAARHGEERPLNPPGGSDEKNRG